MPSVQGRSFAKSPAEEKPDLLKTTVGTSTAQARRATGEARHKGRPEPHRSAPCLSPLGSPQCTHLRQRPLRPRPTAGSPESWAARARWPPPSCHYPASRRQGPCTAGPSPPLSPCQRLPAERPEPACPPPLPRACRPPQPPHPVPNSEHSLGRAAKGRLCPRIPTWPRPSRQASGTHFSTRVALGESPP